MGGGQLGLMMIEAAHKIGLSVTVFAERNLIKSSFKGSNSLLLKMRYFIYRIKSVGL